MICKICGNNNFNKEVVLNPQNLKENYTYYFCTKCSVGFLFDVSEKNLSSNYDEEYNEYEDSENVTNKNFLSKILDLLYIPRREYIKKFATSFDSILDVGCGNGSFLDSVSDLFREFYASEFNEFAFKKAKQKVPGIINVGNDLSQLKGKIAVITLWHVLEHIPNPQEFLEKLKNHMDSESRMIFEVPNSDSLNFKIFKRNYNWISLPEHVFFYNKKSIKYLLDNLDMEIMDITYPRMFPLMASSHINFLPFKVVTIPFSILIFLFGSIFGASESIRITCKLK
jgi:2-polyprenyl-3-methyl-5-hydroxy-6-metoxy-1,4-benzoquinol methylase